jgi:hypothetical protein
MAKRAASPEISLFPFLSILVCLIGALVLLIVVLTIAQGSAAAARDPDEFKRAAAAAKLRQELEKMSAQATDLERKKRAAAEYLARTRPDDARLARLREELAGASTPRGDAPDPDEIERRIQAARVQAGKYEQGRKQIQDAIARLKDELAARNKKPDDKAVPLVVRPGGSASTAGNRPVFVEATAAGLTLLRAGAAPLRVPTESIQVDAGLQSFLEQTARDSKATLIFLVREDGLAAYNRGAGWAESRHGLRTGKLPLPGKGEVDLSSFGIGK